MSRDVSEAAIRAMFAPHTDEIFLGKLMLSHADWPQPYRFTNDRVDHVDLAADTWQGFPFTITLPDDRDDEIGVSQLAIDNTDRQIVQTIRSITSPPAATLWIVLASNIDDVIAGPYDFSLNAATWDALTVTANLEYEPIMNMRWPQHDFTPITTPGLFKQ